MTEVLKQEEDGVLHLIMNRPAKKNALTGAMYEALSAGLDEAAASDSVRAVLISGNGGAFSAGNDVADFLSRKTGDPHELPSVRYILSLTRFPKPLVAAVQGDAVGIGTTMLLHCDLVYAATDARFSTPFTKLGLVPEAGSSLLLPARVGQIRANAMVLLGEVLDAQSALLAGLVNEVVAPDALIEHAARKTETLARLPASVLQNSKRLLQGDRSVLKRHIEDELVAFGNAVQSDEAKAAFNAFLNRAR